MELAILCRDSDWRCGEHVECRSERTAFACLAALPVALLCSVRQRVLVAGETSLGKVACFGECYRPSVLALG